jgi:hypothetical protein
MWQFGGRRAGAGLVPGSAQRRVCSNALPSARGTRDRYSLTAFRWRRTSYTGYWFFSRMISCCSIIPMNTSFLAARPCTIQVAQPCAAVLTRYGTAPHLLFPWRRITKQQPNTSTCTPTNPMLFFCQFLAPCPLHSLFV